ncbi:MAG: hypothetical protein HWQ40_10955 [Nostoc sp. NMS9]|nr:hypothetical protein [Nostoc sp. NMS9]
MSDQSLQYYNGDLLGFVPQPKRQERDGYARRRHCTTANAPYKIGRSLDF